MDGRLIMEAINQTKQEIIIKKKNEQREKRTPEK